MQAKKIMREFSKIPPNEIAKADLEIKTHFKKTGTIDECARIIRDVVLKYASYSNEEKLKKKSKKLAASYMENEKICSYQENWFCILAYCLSVIFMIYRVLDLKKTVNDILSLCTYFFAVVVWLLITNNRKMMGESVENIFIAFNNHAPSWTIISALMFYCAVCIGACKGILLTVIIVSVVIEVWLALIWYGRLKKIEKC